MNCASAVEEVKPEHVWGVWLKSLPNWICCKNCGIVKRRDGKNRPCRGKVGVTTR